MANKNLHRAKKVKNDEFYTKYSDIEKEVGNYKNYLRGKKVYLNCDSVGSNFYKYFKDNFPTLGLELLVATNFSPEGSNIVSQKVVFDGFQEELTELEGDGSYKSPECLEQLGLCDVVVTNPPFSLFRDFIKTVQDSGKKFLVIGSLNAVTYKDFFPLIQKGLVGFGVNSVKEFITPEGDLKKFGNMYWYTNINKDEGGKSSLILTREMGDINYKKFDEYDILNVDRVKDIPKDYYGKMGVPITYLTKHDPDSFKVLGLVNNVRWLGYEAYAIVEGVRKYNRVIIERVRL